MRAKIDEKVVQSIKQSLMLGMNLTEACYVEDISTSTWRRYEEKHPDIRRKRKRWQKALEIRAKVIIANKVYDKAKPSGYYAQYILDRQLDRETKNAQNALTRANARKIDMETQRIKAEIKRLNSGDEGITKIVFADDLKPDVEDDTDQKGDENSGTDTKPK
ncbi:hypothetical protein [Limosilactobacillus oris]|uniref:hypothetical protein n=1 Tax=Limosilactobacillus oris TaxID=1632 RepID=UPI002235700F|nr:hypothetical protein [Limosilactobacillus oris]MCW4387005.1 hypothetical protein [Limosilactobacillus oris]